MVDLNERARRAAATTRGTKSTPHRVAFGDCAQHGIRNTIALSHR
jgi:hypothetical protein